MNFFSGQITPEPLPEFLAPLENHTVIQGRDIFFTCVVNNLHSYKVVCACFFDKREKKSNVIALLIKCFRYRCHMRFEKNFALAPNIIENTNALNDSHCI